MNLLKCLHTESLQYAQSRQKKEACILNYNTHGKLIWAALKEFFIATSTKVLRIKPSVFFLCLIPREGVSSIFLLSFPLKAFLESFQRHKTRTAI